MTTHKPPKVALVHDFLLTFGGAERVLRALADMYPEAPIYTLLADRELVERYFPGREIRTSFLQKFPHWLRKRYHWLLPLYPVAIETLDLRDFDIVLSSSGAWSKGIVTRLHTKHISYLHSPMRFVWDSYHTYPRLQKRYFFFRRLILSYLRLWDREAAARPDVLIANSEYTAGRIRKFYRQEARVVYPPVTQFAQKTSVSKKDFFLIVSRLTSSKSPDLAIEAFNKLGFPLVVVGSGPMEKKLRKIAKKNITFLGRVDDTRLSTLYQEAQALIQPSEEDFGLAAVEALASGTPVIAYRGGAAEEFIIPEVIGELFEAPLPELLADGVRRFFLHKEKYSPDEMKRVSERFTLENFQAGIQKAVEEISSM